MVTEFSHKINICYECDVHVVYSADCYTHSVKV